MAEAVAAVSLGASVITFVDLASNILDRLKDFHGSKDVPKAFEDIFDRLPLLLEKVEEIKKTCDEGRIQPAKAHALTRTVDGCKRQVLALNSIISKCLPVKDNTSAKKESRMRLALKAFRSLYKEKDVIRIRQMLHEYESTLIFYFSDCSQRLGMQTPGQAHAFIYHVPSVAVTRFVGRQTILNRIQEIFDSRRNDHSRPCTIVLHAMGGMNIFC